MLIVAGVSGELFFGLIAFAASSALDTNRQTQIAQLWKDAESAKRDAERARLETAKIEKEYGPRKLTPHQLVSLALVAKPFSGATAVFLVNPNDAEAGNFATQLANPLQAAGWRASLDLMRTWNLRTGIEMNSTDDDESLKASKALAAELGKDGFPVSMDPPEPPNGQFGHRTGIIWVMVNPRPLPKLDASL